MNSYELESHKHKQSQIEERRVQALENISTALAFIAIIGIAILCEVTGWTGLLG